MTHQRSSAFHIFAPGQFEYLPKWLNLIPMIVQWLYLSLLHGSISLPSSANPAITSGGMVGDGKSEYFDIMGQLAKSRTAVWIVLNNSPNLTPEAALMKMREAGLAFPLVAKPEVGWCGYGIRLVENAQQLHEYIRRFPPRQNFLLQAFIPDKGEAGIFYMRFPHQEKGEIIGVLLRSYPKVTGNGKSTIEELVAQEARLQRLKANHLHECRYDPAYVPKTAEEIRLSLIASTRVGGLYEDGTQYVTPALMREVDAVANDMRDFHVGRFDVRYTDIKALQRGEFTIMEVNGAGSEAVHAWDPRNTIAQVYGIVFAKQRKLFAIAAENRKRGHKPTGILELARLFLYQQNLIRHYPPSN